MRRFLLPLLLAVLLIVVWFVVSPPRFWLNMARSVEPTAAVGEQLIEENDCRGCHRIGGEGALKGPDLDDVILRQREADPAQVTLRLWLRNPKAVKPNTAMPNFHLSDSEIEAVLLYLQEQASR